MGLFNIFKKKEKESSESNVEPPKPTQRRTILESWTENGIKYHRYKVERISGSGISESFEEVMTKTRTEGFCEMIKRRFVIGSYSLLKENQQELFFRAQKCRRLIVDTVNNILKEYDAIYMPASPSVAPLEKHASGNKLSNEYLIADNWMAIGNFAGLPSLTLPIGFKDKLPFGGNINGRCFDEETVLLIGKSIENHTGFKNIYAKEE